MSDAGEPIAYTALTSGVPMRTESGTEFGTVDRVLDIPEQDLFDGIVVSTPDGTRFVDADHIAEITTTYVRCSLTDAEVSSLPEPQGNPTYRPDLDRELDSGLWARLKRTFSGARWTKQ